MIDHIEMLAKALLAEMMNDMLRAWRIPGKTKYSRKQEADAIEKAAGEPDSLR
jgi:hypothetical protein